MLETGQPLHAFDRAKLTGAIGVRRARPGEKLTTLDDVVRTLDPDDLVVTDDTGPIALAGVMGGASTEIGPETTDVVLEAAHWEPGTIARTSRRHKLPSEASRRFERDVDPEIAGPALQRCIDLLAAHGGATAVDGYTVVGDPIPLAAIELPDSLPAETAGMPITRDEVLETLAAVGCTTEGGAVLRVQVPSWRPDLLQPADLVEEVVRLVGYDKIPSVLPVPEPGHGFTPEQTLRRTISRAVAAAGFSEVFGSPFVAPGVHDALGEPADDPRRRTLRLVNPLSDAEPELRTSLLPGLVGVVQRNLGRGIRDLAVFEIGLVFSPARSIEPPPRPALSGRPSDTDLEALFAAIPVQPRHLAVLLTGDVERRSWSGAARPATWADAVDAARVVARAARVELTVRAGRYAPWHPGRCAELLLDGRLIGHAGELHPRAIAALDLPERTCAMELDLDAFAPPSPATAPVISNYPPVLLDVALVVPVATPAVEVEAALREGAGELLESVRLFDSYADEQRLGPGLRSLAFELVLRAPDRTLTVEEATVARDAAIALAGARSGATLRT
jgi:phenylalanyl-tRNA synthetase beta chain